VKVLIVSNLYPPYYRGGYELHCAKMVEELHRRGHDVLVVTSTYGLAGFTVGSKANDQVNRVPVKRLIRQYAFESKPLLPPWTVRHARHELSDARLFRTVIMEFQPDVVNWWNLNGVSKLLPAIVAALKIPDVYFVDDQWMIRELGHDGSLASTFWRNLWDGRWGPASFRGLARAIGCQWRHQIDQEGINTQDLDIHPSHVCFQSRYLYDLHAAAGFHFPSWQVIYGGVDVNRFYTPVGLAGHVRDRLRVLYAGQVSPDRGLHNLVEAWGQMPAEAKVLINLTVAGGGVEAYIDGVQLRLRDLGLADRTVFLGHVPYESMNEVYRSHDVMVFTSTRPEGQGFTMVEAMVAGCAVLTTGSGGAMEIATLADLPVFPRNDSVALSNLLTQLVADRERVREIAKRGQRVALRELSADQMVSQVEAMLLRICNTEQPSRVAVAV
jgi:glycosyltransferase involved in cell wall biosynthesis